MKKYFCVGDVHGFYDEMINSLQTAGYDITNPNHIFVSCGDLMDRGPMPLKCLKFVNSIPEQQKILVRGNHEDLIEEAIRRKDLSSHDYHNGTAQTIVDLSDVIFTNTDDMYKSVKQNIEYQKYIQSLVDFGETEHYVFVHGWIPCKSSDDNMYHSKNIKYSEVDDWSIGNWDSARWINGMDAWRQGVIVPNKTVVCGHWHTSWGHCHIDNKCDEFSADADFSPFVHDGIIALDGCTAYTRKVNCVVIED